MGLCARGSSHACGDTGTGGDREVAQGGREGGEGLPVDLQRYVVVRLHDDDTGAGLPGGARIAWYPTPCGIVSALPTVGGGHHLNHRPLRQCRDMALVVHQFLNNS